MRRLSEIRHKVASLAVKGFFSKSNDMDRGYEEKEKTLDSTIFSQYPEQTKTDHPPPPPGQKPTKQTNMNHLSLPRFKQGFVIKQN